MIGVCVCVYVHVRVPVWWWTWGMRVHTAFRVIENLTWEMFAQRSMKVPERQSLSSPGSQAESDNKGWHCRLRAALSPQSLACYRLMHYSGAKYAQISPLKPNLLALLKEFHGCWWPLQGRLNCECTCQGCINAIFSRTKPIGWLASLALEHYYLALLMFMFMKHIKLQKVTCKGSTGLSA